MKYIVPALAVIFLFRIPASCAGEAFWGGLYSEMLGQMVVRSTFNAPGTVPVIAPGTTLYIINEDAIENIWFDGFAMGFTSSTVNNADPLNDVEIKFSISGVTQSFTTADIRNLLNDVTTDRAPPGFSISTLSTASGSRAIYFSYKNTFPVRTPRLQLFVVNNNQSSGLRMNAVAAQWRK